MLLSDPGNLVSEQWLELPIRFPSIVIDEFVVMPNHFHGIIYTTDSTLSKPSLSEIVGSFKSIVTHKYIDGVNNKNWVPFDRRLWQRNYYERIVRNDLELQNIQQYIQLAQQDSPSIAVLRLGVGGMRVSDRRAKPHQRRMHPHTRRKGIASGRWAGV